MAVAPLVVEYTRTRVSSSQGRSVRASANPPQRSTTFRPRWKAANAAPTSEPSAKLASKARRTSSNPGAVHPPIVVTRLPRSPGPFSPAGHAVHHGPSTPSWRERWDRGGELSEGPPSANSPDGPAP